MKTTEWTIEELWIYPVKSCAGISVKSIQVDAWGPQWDRQWMIVNAQSQFITQRTRPQMAKMVTRLSESSLLLSFDNKNFEVPFQSHQEDFSSVVVWQSTVNAKNRELNGLNSALSEYLGEEARLVEFSQRSHRKVVVNGETLKNDVRFADGFPWLLVNRASLNELNSRLEKKGDLPIPMNRFRANVIVSGGSAFSEDQISEFQCSDLILKNIKPCSRCPIITVDQKIGIKTGSEPLQTLSQYRRGDKGKVFFGVNLIHSGEGKLSVGEKLRVTSVNNN